MDIEGKHAWWLQWEVDGGVNKAAASTIWGVSVGFRIKKKLVWPQVLNGKTSSCGYSFDVQAQMRCDRTHTHMHTHTLCGELIVKCELSYSVELLWHFPREPALSGPTAVQMHQTGMMSSVVTSGQDVSWRGNRPTVGSHLVPKRSKPLYSLQDKPLEQSALSLHSVFLSPLSF